MEGVIFSEQLRSIRLTNADPRDNKRSIPLHQKVLAAIEAQDADAAEAAMKEHLEGTRERLAQFLSEANGGK
jgi:DNA-binding FadR family transcriptional regulator